MGSIKELPDNCWEEIFDRCNQKTLSKISLCCKQYNKLFKTYLSKSNWRALELVIDASKINDNGQSFLFACLPFNLTSDCLKSFPKFGRGRVCIRFKNKKELTDKKLAIVLNKLGESVFSLDLTCCANITVKGLRQIVADSKQMSNITSLNLTCFENLTNKDIIAITNHEHMSKLTNLNLQFCNKIKKDALITSLARRHPNLKIK